MEFTDLFDSACCYDWFENVVHGRDDSNGNDGMANDEGEQEDLPYAFEQALQSLKSPPAIRAAGPHMLRVLSEWLGANDSRLKVLIEPVVDSLCVQLDIQCKKVLADHSMAMVDTTMAMVDTTTHDDTTMTDKTTTHADTTSSGGATTTTTTNPLSSRFVTSVVFCFLCVFDVYQWEIFPVARLYWSWLSYLLQTKEDADVQKLMSPMILSLILKPAHTAAKVALPELTRAIEFNPLTLASSFLTTEAGLEVIRKILDTFATGYKDIDQPVIYNFVKILTLQALKISKEGEGEGEERSRILYPLSAASEDLLVSPIITLSNLILRLALPYLNQTKAKTKECQAACIKILKALADHAPELFLRDDIIKQFYQLNEQTNSSSQSSQTKVKTTFHHLYDNVTSPWISFIAMAMTSLPERKDCRERACSIIMDCLDKCPNEFYEHLCQVLRMLAGFHDRGTVRLASIEMLTMLAAKNSPSFENIFRDLIIRTSDSSAIVRARALELLAQIIAGNLNNIEIIANGYEENINPEGISPSPMILISQSPGRSTVFQPTEAENAMRSQIQCVLHARVLDEKSVVRKGCVPLIEVIYQHEVLQSELHVIERDLLEVLADDLIITIRQRFVSALVSMLSFWLEGTGAGDITHVKLILIQLTKLAGDAEEVVYNKVLDAVDTLILPTLRKACSDTTLPEQRRTRAHTLLMALVGDEECYEWTGRALIRLLECRYSETSPWSGPSNEYSLILKLMCSKPRGVNAIRLLLLLVNAAHRALCKTPGGQVSSQQAAACLCIFEDITPQLGTAHDLPLCITALEILTHLAPVHVDVKNRKLIYESFYQALLAGAIHPSLVLKVALLTIVIMPKESASATCMAYLSYAKRQLSKFKIQQPAEELRATSSAAAQADQVSGRVLACACLLCGFVSSAQLVLKCSKLSKFLQQMNKALAVTILSISRYHEEAAVRSMAFIAASQVLLNDESLAKRHMSKLVQTAAISSNSPAIYGPVNNLPFVTYDFSVCRTSVMDPYLTIVTSCLAQSYGASSEHRFAALLLVSQLAGLDFIKCKGLIMHHVIYALGDECEEVSELAYGILQTVLMPRLKDLILVYFAETVCFLTGYYEHHCGNIRAFTFAHPLQKEVLKAYEELNVCAFQCPEDHDRRFKIYSKLLSLSQEQSKHLLTGKLLQDFIKPLVPMEDILPTEATNNACGRALADVLRILASADMKLRFKHVATSNDNLDASELGNGTAETLAKAKYERELMASYMTQNVVPTLLLLHQALRKKNSALQRDVVEAIADIVVELECNMDDLINDKALRRRVEERISALAHTCASSSIFDPLSDGSRKKLIMSTQQ